MEDHMNSRNELISCKNDYSVKLNRAADYIADMQYTRTEALRYLDRGLLAEGRNFIEAQIEYLSENITGNKDDNFYHFAIDFIGVFYSPDYIEQYKVKEFTSFELKWLTELNSVLIEYIDKLMGTGTCLGILSGLALYSSEKHVSKCHFNAICDRLPFSDYLYSLELVGLNTDCPSGEYLGKIFHNYKDIMDENDDPLRNEFFAYFENLKIPVPGISDKVYETIRQSLA